MIKSNHQSRSRAALVPTLVWGLVTCFAVSARAADEAPAAPSAPAGEPPSGQVPPPAQDVPVNPQPTSGDAAHPAAPTTAEATLTAAPAQPPPPASKALTVGGGVILWYYKPVDIGGAKSNVDLFFANLLLDGKFGAFALHVEPRFRDSRLRDFFPGPVWAQEAYASATLASNLVLKAGKAYSHFGLFWDNSFYGNVQVYDGLKLDPDYGLSLEGAAAPDGKAGLRYWAQYFVVDGHTNVSLAGRDTISLPGGHRRNQAILRVEPFYRVTEHATLTAGLSGAFLQAELGPTAGTKNVFRGAADLSLVLRQFSAWAEYTRQNGQSVTDFPVASTAATPTAPGISGQASSHNNYGLVGAQFVVGQVSLRYNVSTGRYEDVHVSEWMHVPAVAYALGDNFTVLAEYVDWRRYTPGASSVVDHSLDVTLAGHF
jgi:hypothetical protein